MELTDKNDFGDGCHMENISLSFSFMIPHTSLSKKSVLAIDTNGRCIKAKNGAHPLTLQDNQLRASHEVGVLK